MRLALSDGLWSAGTVQAPAPLLAVLEVSGAVLSWVVDESAGPAITFTDPTRADWLWRVVGDTGHVAILDALHGDREPAADALELPETELGPGALDTLRRLALGHWMRRWWPASAGDGIAHLDLAVLDAEIALLTAAAQDYFTDDTLDSDVAALLTPHGHALIAHLTAGANTVADLVRDTVELAADAGVDGPGWSELYAALDNPDATAAAVAVGTRDDYALAAGTPRRPGDAVTIAAGTASIRWGGVPPWIFDAAEDTVQWQVDADGSTAQLSTVLSGPEPATGVPARLESGQITGEGVLDAGGRARLPLVDSSGNRVTETLAWHHDWSQTEVTIGAGIGEGPDIRTRVRQLARTRLADPGADAFLAERLATDSDY